MPISTETVSGSRVVLVLAVCSVLSRLAGVVRDRLLATTFGAGATLDAYYAAFKIPDLIFNTLVLGAIAAAFIPTYVNLRRSQGNQAAWGLSKIVILAVVVVLSVLALAGIIFAPWLVHNLIAPGFDSERTALTISLTRIMLLATVVFGASNVVGSVLQAEQKFTAFAIAPILYNVGIIIGLYTVVPFLGNRGLAWGVVLGALLHLLIQLPALRRIPRLGPPPISLQLPLKAVLRLLGPRTIGLAAGQVEQLMMAGFISQLSVGSMAAFALASNLQSFPTNVFGVSLAVAAFPLLSRAWSESDPVSFIHHFSSTVRRTIYYVLPLAVLFLVLRAQIVRVVLGAGAFDWGDTIRTSQVLGFLSLAMLADSIIPTVARAFYAIGDTKTPTLAALVAMVVNLFLLLSLVRFGLTGIGIAYVTSRLLNLGLLSARLGKKLGTVGAEHIVEGSRVILTAALTAGVVAYLALRVVAPFVDMHTFLGVAFQGLVAGCLGISTYLSFTYVNGLSEARELRQYLHDLLVQAKLFLRLA